MPRLPSLLLLAVMLASTARAGFLDWLLPKHDVQVITVTDTTPAGALRRAVSPSNPAYYQAVSAGYREFGGTIAGEKIPPKEDVIKAITRVLAKQGFLPSTTENPPTLLLIWTWGTMNTDRIYSGDPDDTQGQQINRNQLLRFMGAYKLGMIPKEREAFPGEMMPGLLFRDADSELLSDLASEDLYVAAISAYDYAAMAKKQRVLLWTTKISCPSLGLSLPETLPTMLALAGPNIGRETAKPVSVRATDKFRPEVKIGDPSVVDYLDKAPSAVVEIPAKAKTAPKGK